MSALDVLIAWMVCEYLLAGANKRVKTMRYLTYGFAGIAVAKLAADLLERFPLRLDVSMLG